MKDQTEIVVVADRSGSMSGLVEDMIGGFDTFIEEQKKLDKPAFVTLVQFDDQYEVVYARKPLAEVPSLRATYVARGGTALNDAIGRTINELGAQLAALPEEERPNKVIFKILTDGEENQSREFSTAQIREMVKRQQEVYNWTFLFIGAGIDAYHAGGGYGIAASNVISGSRGMLKGAYGASSAAVMRSRGLSGHVEASMDMFSYAEKVGAGDVLGIGVTPGTVTPSTTTDLQKQLTQNPDGTEGA